MNCFVRFLDWLDEQMSANDTYIGIFAIMILLYLADKVINAWWLNGGLFK